MDLVYFLLHKNISFFNELGFYSVSSLTLVLFFPSLLLIALYFIFKIIGYKAMPGKFQNFIETSYEIIEFLILEQITEEYAEYAPYLIGIFYYILILNLMNLIFIIPSATSQIVIDFTISFFIYVYLFLTSIEIHGFNFWKQFIPSGVPSVLKPFLFILEFILFFLKSVTLSLRLALSLEVGHLIIKGFINSRINTILSNIFTFILIFPILLLEFFVMFLQAYLFLLLLCMSCKDLLKSH